MYLKSARLGLASKISKKNKSFWTSGERTAGLVKPNVRLFYGMRAIGEGHSAAQNVCTQNPAKSITYAEVIGKAVEFVFNIVFVNESSA